MSEAALKKNLYINKSALLHRHSHIGTFHSNGPVCRQKIVRCWYEIFFLKRMHLDFSKCMPHRQETHTAANRKQKSQHVSISHLNSSPSECRWFGGVSVVASETHKNEHRLLQKCTELFAAWQRSECEGFPSCDACIFPDFYASQRVFVCPPAWQLPFLIGRT